MYRIGIDMRSAYTKYCVMCADHIMSLVVEKTPIRQKGSGRSLCFTISGSGRHRQPQDRREQITLLEAAKKYKTRAYHHKAAVLKVICPDFYKACYSF